VRSSLLLWVVPSILAACIMLSAEVIDYDKYNDNKQAEQKHSTKEPDVPLVGIFRVLYDKPEIITALATGVIAWFTWTLAKATRGLQELAIKQSEDTANSIREAARAATAMEQVSDSLSKSAASAAFSVETSRQIAERQKILGAMQLRAFVFPVNIFSHWVNLEDIDQYGWRMRPVWQNSGATPTKNLKIHAWGELRDSRLPDGFDFDASSQEIGSVGSGLIPPRLTLHGGLVPPGKALTPSDILQIYEGKKIFYMWGWARYNDVFEDTPQHITRFCWVVTPVGDPLSFKPNSVVAEEKMSFPFLFHTEGNCADEECG